MKANPEAITTSFWKLHAFFAHVPELVQMRAQGMPERTLLHLYPVEGVTYLPYFRARFETRRLQRLHNMWAVSGATIPYRWEIREMLDWCSPESSRVYNDTKLPDELKALRDEYDPPSPSSWNQSNLTFEITDVLDLMSRLAHFDAERFEQMPRRNRSTLLKVLAKLPQEFDAYEQGIHLWDAEQSHAATSLKVASHSVG